MIENNKVYSRNRKIHQRIDFLPYFRINKRVLCETRKKAKY